MLPLAVKVVERDVHYPDRPRSGLPALDGHDQYQTYVGLASEL